MHMHFELLYLNAIVFLKLCINGAVAASLTRFLSTSPVAVSSERGSSDNPSLRRVLFGWRDNSLARRLCIAISVARRPLNFTLPELVARRQRLIVIRGGPSNPLSSMKGRRIFCCNSKSCPCEDSLCCLQTK